MQRRRHISFVAVLIACTVMFLHAVIPHHHRASDLAICTEAIEPCRHHNAPVIGACGSEMLIDADCDCHCNSVGCAAPLPFTLRCGDDHPTHPDIQLLVAHDRHAGTSLLQTSPETRRATAHFITDSRLIAQWCPRTRAGRAPPVL